MERQAAHSAGMMFKERSEKEKAKGKEQESERVVLSSGKTRRRCWDLEERQERQERLWDVCAGMEQAQLV